MNNYGILLYGPRYIGTTSFVKALPKSIVYSVNSVSDADYNINSWREFKEIIEVAEADEKLVFEHTVIDKVTDLYGMCIDYICDQKGVTDFQELGANRSSLVAREYKEVMYKFNDLPGIKWYICPEQSKKTETSLYIGTLIFPKWDWLFEQCAPQLTKQTIYMGIQQFRRELDDSGSEYLVRIPARTVFMASPHSGILSGDSFGILPKRWAAPKTPEESAQLYFQLMKGRQDE